MGTILEFTDDEKSILRDLIKNHRAEITRPPLSTSERTHQAPETYIAKPQTAAGIPGLLPTGVGTGTDVSGSEYDEPGVAECDIYRIQVNQTTGDPELQAIPGLSKMVYNLSTTDLPQSWLTITRTKSGRWIAVVGGGAVEVVTDYRVDTANLKLQKKTRTVYAGASEESDWVDVHQGVDCAATGTGS